jgi:hypothetical protein
MVSIVNNKIHPRKPDYFMKLIPSFVDTTIPRHESPDLFASFLNALGEKSSDF